MKELLIPVEEYLSTMYHPDCEFVDGVLVERNVGERDHSRWQAKLCAFFEAHAEEWGIYTFTEWRMRIRARRYRIPDLTVVRGAWPETHVLEAPPFLVVEIWSPDDKPSEFEAKVRDYRELGIPHILLIYPDEPRFVLYTQDAEQQLHDGVLRIGEPVIEVPLMEIHNRICRRT